MMNLCRHCDLRPANRSRGLCYRCYDDLEVRHAHPTQFEAQSNSRREMSHAELDELIAQQLPTMPAGNDTGGERSPCGRILERAIEMGQLGRRVQRKAGRR